MKLDYVISHLVPLIHAPILICQSDGTIQNAYGGQSLKHTALAGDNEFRQRMLGQASDQLPTIMQVEENCLFAVLLQDEKQGIIVGPYVLAQGKTRSQFLSGILILWHMLTGMECSASDVAEDASARLEERVSDIIFDRQERQTAHNPYEKEQREQECIRVGNPEELHRCINETYEGEFGVLASNPLRQSKNIAIGMITLASRSAIAGGLHPELSFSMADGYIYEIEENMHDSLTVEQAAFTAQLAFAKKVQEKKTTAESNPIVRKAKDYIFKNMHSKISVRQMAETLRVHPDYLSALFRQFEHRTITAYILEEKLNLCQNLLKYSSYSIQEISAYFAFTSQSYFTQQFKKYTGMTPLSYRHMLQERKSG